MRWGRFIGKSRTRENPLEDPENLAKLLVALSGKWDTPALIAFLADERARLLLCKALISPVSGADRKLAQRALHILRFRGMDPEHLKKRLEPAALALGLVSSSDVQIDYYHVLDVEPSATPPELRAAYRKKAFELHPDTAQGKKGKSTDFGTLQTAYDTLMDPNSRAAFDRCRVQLGSWQEQRLGESPGAGAGRRSAGKLRKTSYRIAGVVVVMVVIAWVLSILYESETILELAQVTSSTESGPAREMAGADIGKMENKTPVLSELVEDRSAPKPEPKRSAQEKPAPKKSGLKKSGLKKIEPEPLKTAGLALPEPVEAREPIKAQARLNGDPHQAKLMSRPTEGEKPSSDVKAEDKGANEKPKGAPASEPVEVKVLPSAEPGKKQTPVVPESSKNELKDLLKPAKKEKVIDNLQTKKPQVNFSATPQVKRAAVPEDPASTDSSIQGPIDSPVRVFPDTPIPKTHKTPFIKRSQVLAFLKQYTAAYERGNAETFFSYFTANATENGKPLEAVKPDYLEVWDKLQDLDYRILVTETEQVVGSDMVSMEGRFDLDWKFFDGQSGQSHGDIFMDLKVHKNVLRISRLDYRFD